MNTIAEDAKIAITPVPTPERRALVISLKAERATGDMRRSEALVAYMIEHHLAPIYRPSRRNTMASDWDSQTGQGPATIADCLWMGQAWVEQYARLHASRAAHRAL